MTAQPTNLASVDRPGTAPDHFGPGSFPSIFESVASNVAMAIYGKDEVVRLAVTCMFAGGHLLVEDVPGVGKTMLAKALANTIGGTFGRVQFTPDLLPSDVIGTSVWNQGSGEFVFHRGPIFSNVLLADEVNRASPKTQSALLEAMAENQATVDGRTIDLEQPFMVIATQNPIEHHGTYPLPESQLDRFLMKVSIGYPDSAAETDLLLRPNHDSVATSLKPILSLHDIKAISNALKGVHVSEALASYMVALAAGSRRSDRLTLGISPRALIGLLRAAKVHAAATGRSFVTPDDVKLLAVPVLAHRVIPVGLHQAGRHSADAIVDLLESTPVMA